MIATKVNQEEIIYCVDSMYPPGLLYQESIVGIEFDRLKQIGINEFGNPKSDIAEGMKDLFFIDSTNRSIPKMKKWNWLDFKYAEQDD